MFVKKREREKDGGRTSLTLGEELKACGIMSMMTFAQIKCHMLPQELLLIVVAAGRQKNEGVEKSSNLFYDL